MKNERRPLPTMRVTSASRARLPPSPLLSARIMKARYFTVTTAVTDQKISDSTPKTCASSSASGWAPAKLSFMT